MKKEIQTKKIIEICDICKNEEAHYYNPHTYNL